jgi:transaldolase
MIKFFLDTASTKEIKIWKKMKLVNGVTTNPILLGKEKADPINVLKEICNLTPGPVSAQVTEKKFENMIYQGINLSKINKKIIIKLPCNHEGLKAAEVLKKKKIKINITLGFNPAQIVGFANLNVDYFSLIIGKTEDWGFSNIDSIKSCKKIIKNRNY